MKPQSHRSLYRIKVPAETSSGCAPSDRESRHNRRRLVERRKFKGQAIVIVALMVVLLILMIGLAVDGGSMMNQRREAQNAVDGSALAGTRTMLPYYQQMIYDNPNGDVDWNGTYELNIRTAIDTYAAMNGVMTTTLESYFINDDKQIITVNNGVGRDGERCGNAEPRGPCEVGENGRVPWTLGAKGIMVKGTAQTASFFMSIFGYNNVAANAIATAFMGVGASVDNIGLVPMGLFTDDLDIANLHVGDHHILIEANEDQGSGNWGWVDYNGMGSSRVIGKNWLICGYNPSVRNEAQWRIHCPDETTTWNEPRNYGPTQHYEPINHTNWDPKLDPTYVYSLIFGETWHGWWVYGSSGAVNANCQDLERKVNRSTEGYAVLFPIFDRQVDDGPGSYFHVRIVVAFMLYPGYVTCRPAQPPTPTPCIGPCPTATPGSGGGGGGTTHWHVEGDVIKIYSTSSNGRHGDLRQTTVPVIFLDN